MLKRIKGHADSSPPPSDDDTVLVRLPTAEAAQEDDEEAHIVHPKPDILMAFTNVDALNRD